MPAVTVRRRSSTLPLVLAVLFVGLVVIVAGFLLYLFAGGSVTVPFTDPPTVLSFQKQEEQAKPSRPPGTIAVFISSRNVPAYTQVSRDDVWDKATNQYTIAFLKADQFSDDMFRADDDKSTPDVNESELGALTGRVLARSKRRGYVFRESDFKKKGTRPGVVAGIPPGKGGVKLQEADARKFSDLREGDRFDLLATVELDGDVTDSIKNLGGAHASRLAVEAEIHSAGKRSRVDVIVRGGIVVTPMRIVQVEVGAGSLHDPHRQKTRPVPEVFVAVSLEEVTLLTQALKGNAEITVVPRSGDPDGDASVVQPLRPKSPFSSGEDDGAGGAVHLVEQIGGKNREIVPVPTEKK